MISLVDVEPVEIASPGLNVGPYVGESEKDSLHEFTIIGSTDGSSFTFKVRLYSLDVVNPQETHCAGCTMSLGALRKDHVQMLLMGSFRRVILKLEHIGIELQSATLMRMSYAEEDSGTCSLVIDASGASLVNLDTSA